MMAYLGLMLAVVGTIVVMAVLLVAVVVDVGSTTCAQAVLLKGQAMRLDGRRSLGSRRLSIVSMRSVELPIDLETRGTPLVTMAA